MTNKDKALLFDYFVTQERIHELLNSLPTEFNSSITWLNTAKDNLRKSIEDKGFFGLWSTELPYFVYIFERLSIQVVTFHDMPGRTHVNYADFNYFTIFDSEGQAL